MSATLSHAQTAPNIIGLRSLGTRNWIRLTWDGPKNQQANQYNIYWSAGTGKPDTGVLLPGTAKRYYITPLKPKTSYHIWVDAYTSKNGIKTIKTTVYTDTAWKIDTAEANHLSIPSSQAVPAGMQLFWQDEFNDALLNKNKWSTNYYSTIDFLRKTNLDKLQQNTLPQPGIIMTGNSIKLIVNDSVPAQPYSGQRKISSIQTYDWRSNECLLDNRRGGYFEVRVRRSNTPGVTPGLNAAFWLDSPGPDLKYYLEKGGSLQGVDGVRPHGQAFEIDVFEEDDDAATSNFSPFTMHGKVSPGGIFQRNLMTFNASLTHQTDWVTHGILWTPAGIKYYINGVLQKQWTDTSKNMSPNHLMNILIGNYYTPASGTKDNAVLEVDYIRGYQWPVSMRNELPNPGFEYGTPEPWTGTGSVAPEAKRTGNAGLLLLPGQQMKQCVYLDNSKQYQLQYWAKGGGKLRLQVKDIAQVTGATETSVEQVTNLSESFSRHKIIFVTGKEYKDNMKTVEINFINVGKSAIAIDDLVLKKVR